MSAVLDALPRVVETVVAPAAADVDRDGTFPEASLAALAEIGVLGLVSATEVGGGGAGFDAAAAVIEQLAGACGSTAMVVLMHYAATAAIEAYGSDDLRRSVAAGDHLTTLAFSEAGSRSHFWAPLSTATAPGDGDGDDVLLAAHKSWVTSAAHARTFVWSSTPLAAEGPMTLWAVPRDTPGLRVVTDGFDGFGLRGNESTPVMTDGVRVPRAALLGADGAGLDQALQVVLPWFLTLSAAFSLGVSEAVVDETRRHLLATRLEHLDRSLAQEAIPRLEFAKLRVDVDRTRALLADTLGALASGRADAMLRVLEVKAVAAESAASVTDAAMKLCGGAAFRKEVGIERRFRDARAARVMAPTTDALLDIVGRAVLELPLLGEV
jgi:alkylation response protein AidB-like acyl-CoA dehydrogenase